LNLMFFKVVGVLRRATSSSEIISYILYLNYVVDDDQMQNVFICVGVYCVVGYTELQLLDCMLIAILLRSPYLYFSKSFHDAVFLL
jgi:hypothetical protein